MLQKTWDESPMCGGEFLLDLHYYCALGFNYDSTAFMNWGREVYIQELNDKIKFGRSRLKKRTRTVESTESMKCKNRVKGTWVELSQYREEWWVLSLWFQSLRWNVMSITLLLYWDSRFYNSIYNHSYVMLSYVMIIDEIELHWMTSWRTDT